MNSLCWIWIAILTAAPLDGARVLVGRQEARYVFHAAGLGVALPNYKNNGFSQKVVPRGRRQTVRTVMENKVLGSGARARRVSGLAPELAALERALNDLADKLLVDQVNCLFQWLRQEIVYETQWVPDQSLEKVLRTRQANCVGLSGLAIHVLTHMDLEARYVTGIALRPDDKAAIVLEGTVLHRWIEIRYPDVGWVFADPAGKVNYIEANYLILGIQGLHPLAGQAFAAQGSKLELIKLSDGLHLVGFIKGLDQRLAVRPNRLYWVP